MCYVILDYEYDTTLKIFLKSPIRGVVKWNTLRTKSAPVINGNRQVGVLNRYDSRRKLNLNNFDGDWNDNYRFLAVRNYRIFSR